MIGIVPWPSRTRSDDATLVRRLRQGDREALAQVYERESAAVYRFAYALCGNASWAADATHDAFIALAMQPDSFDPARGTLGARLAGVARHALLAQWRAAQRHDSVDAPDAYGDGPIALPCDSLLVQRQDIDTLWAAIRALPWPLREALVLVDLQERPYEQAAAIAGIELNTLRSRLHRARARLASLLGVSLGEAA